jgi:hypothetical protein
MTEIQILAFIIIPIVVALVGYLMVIYHEREGHSKEPVRDLTFANLVIRYPFQLAQASVRYRIVIVVLTFAYKFSLGAFVTSIVASKLDQPWSDIVATFGGLFTAIVASIIPIAPTESA